MAIWIKNDSEVNPELVRAAHKTVQMFAGILNKPLKLVDFSTPCCDGHTVNAPFNSPALYELVEHEVSHIALGSDAFLIHQTCMKYIRKRGLNLSKNQHREFGDSFNSIANILDDRRVKSLWAVPFPGSVAKLNKASMTFFAPSAMKWVSSFVPFMSLIELDPSIAVWTSSYQPDAVKAKVLEAFKTVDGSGFLSVLTATTTLVDWLLLTEPKALFGISGSSVHSVPSFFTEFSVAVGRSLEDKDVEDLLDGKDMSEAMNVQNSKVMGVLTQIEDEIGRSGFNKKWLADSLNECTNFAPSDGKPVVLSESDRSVASKLRNRLMRLREYRENALADYGYEIDPVAFLEAKASKEPAPFFKGDGRALRGFKVMLLLDLSSSMKDDKKSVQAERVFSILREALDFPGVTVTMWGFSGSDEEVNLFVYDEERVRAMDPDGNTPTFAAARAASRYLAEYGGEEKHLLIVTDGEPYSSLTHDAVGSTHYEIDRAEQSGIYTRALVVGTNTDDELLDKAFGRSRYIRLGVEFERTLIETVEKTFAKYLKC